MELKIIVKNTFSLATTKVVQMFTGILRAKINAIFLGTEGVGIVSQVLYSTTMFSNFTMLGMNDGIVKQISSCNDEALIESQILNSVKSFFILVSFGIVLVLLAAYIFSEELTIYFFGDLKYYNYYLICVVSFPILILNSTSFAILKSFKKVKEIARAELYSALLSFILYIPIVIYFGLGGAIVVTILTFVIKFYFNHLHSKSKVLDNYGINYLDIIRKGHVVRKDLRELMIFGGYGLTIGFYEIFIEVISRSFVVNSLGISQLGLYAPLQAWGGLFSGLMLPTIFTYLFPRFSEAKNNYKDINAILNDVFRLVTFASLPFLFLGISMKTIVIPLFYSNEFIGSVNYLAGHFLGVLFTLWLSAFTQVFTPIGKVTIYTIFLFFMHSLKLLLVFLLIPIYGLYGWMAMFMLPPLVFFFVFYIYLKKQIGFNLIVKNVYLMLYAVGIAVLLEYLAGTFGNLTGYILAPLFLLLSVLLMTDNEKLVIKLKITNSLRLK